MRFAFAWSTLALSASIPVVRSHVHLPRNGSPAENHWFDLTAKSVQRLANGHVGQLNDGQCRIGGSLSRGQYRIKDDKIWDYAGRGCIVTAPEGQWQCDDHANPTPGFAVDCKGEVTYTGKTGFYACPVNDNGEWNIYISALAGQNKCVQITLSANGYTDGGCKAKPMTTSNPPHEGLKTNSSSHCPLDLDGPYEFPHLIVPVEKNHPNYPIGNKLNGTIGQGKCTIFNFDIKPDHAGKTCSLIFLLPQHNKLGTSSYRITGDGSLQFVEIPRPATERTTWSNMGRDVKHLGSPISTSPGSKYVIYSHECAAGKKVAFRVCSTHDLALEFFQDFNPEPIGLYVRVC